MECFGSREELSSGVVDAFAREPEVREIHVFGREVDGATDEYSDIDVIVCSSDPRRTAERHLDLLSRISPVIGTYVIKQEEGELAEMVMLRDFSPYQKIDLSIVGSIEAKAGFGPFKCVYREANVRPGRDEKRSPRPLAGESGLAVPLVGTAWRIG